MEDKVILQEDLNCLFAWDKTWGLSFNVSKRNFFTSLDRLLNLWDSTP